MIALRLLHAAAAATSGAAVAMAQLNLPSREFWAEWVALAWAGVAVGTALLLYDGVRSVSIATQYHRSREFESNLRAAMSAAIVEVVDAFGVPWDEIAVQYYRARRRLWTLKLAQVCGVRAGTAAIGEPRTLRASVGLIGVAFSDQVIISVPWREFAREATEQGPEKWSERSARERFGLTWGQLRRVARPEGAVASPTFDTKGKANGCILITGPLKVADLSGETMRQVLDDLAATLDQIGPPPPGWWSTNER